MECLTDTLRGALGGRILIVGVGNTSRGDDGVGPCFVRAVQGRVRALCLDTGTAPENYLERIVGMKPDTVWLVDATGFGGEPGEVRLFEAERIASGALSTHALSLRLVCEYLKNRLPVRVYLLAVQPELTHGECLSETVRGSLNRLVHAVTELIPPMNLE